MDFRKVAILLPYNKDFEILFQYRKNLPKKHTRDYGFFGGGLEEGETVEQALAREIMEELELDINQLKDLEFFRQFNFESKEMDRKAELNLFLCKMPDLTELKVNAGAAKVLKLKEALNLYISPWDKKMLKEVLRYLKSK